VTVRYSKNTTWPLPTEVDWGDADRINEAVQIIDGKWAIDNGQLQPVELGYDRLIGLGDKTWTDYEVMVPFTLKGIDPRGYIGVNNGPNIGFGMRWGGHFDAGNGTQPRSGWQNLGALAVYRWQPDQSELLQLYGFGGGTLGVNTDKPLAFDTPYMAKISVQSALTGTAYYRFKVWPAAENEPITWDLEAFGLEGEPTAGSVVLQAHFADVRFGNVTVRPLSAIQPKLTIIDPEHGTITATPEQEQYTYGERVTLQAVPELGYQFVQWGSDISSTNSTVDIYITKDTTASATFVAAPPPTIAYTETANGIVSWTPQKDQYTYGEEVTFVATPAIGFMLAEWGGNVPGNANPLTIAIDRNLRIEPRFVPATAPFSDDFNACSLNTTYWSFVDPVGDTTFAVNGTQVTIDLPAGSDHDLWEDKNLAPRFMQTMENGNFDLVTKFESLLTRQFQMEGMIIEQDADNFLRTDFYSDINGMHVFAASFTDGTATTHFSTPITPSGSQLHLRVTRTGDEWAIRYSFDGNSWTTAGTFTYAITVAKAGFFAGNAAGDASPASTVVVDSFMNMSAPIVNEDGKSMAIGVDTNGDGTGAVDISPSKLSYACGEKVTLNAIPANGSLFTGWSGSISGSTNPLTIDFAPGTSVVATFEASTVNFKLYLPVIAK
jgi:regulation of enolase protein 1 (concanavalin A-like superfamily)